MDQQEIAGLRNLNPAHDRYGVIFVGLSFLFPWAIAFGDLGLYGYWSVIVFLGVLTVGFIYEWRKGALEWD